MAAACMLVFTVILWENDLLNPTATDFSHAVVEKNQKQEEKEGKTIMLDYEGFDVHPSLVTKEKNQGEGKVGTFQQWAGEVDEPLKTKVDAVEEKESSLLENDDLSSYTNLDGSPYKWREHSLSEGLIYIHDQKVMRLPEGRTAKMWLQRRCHGFDLKLEGIRTGMCYKSAHHPLVVDQRICKATKDDETYANNAVWAVSKTNPLYEEDMYTLVVPAFLRIKALVKSMVAFAKCSQLSSYHIVWGNPNKSPPIDVITATWEEVTRGLKDRKPLLHIHLMSFDTLNNRYLDLPGINTRAVVHIDDDQTTSCRDMQRLLVVWRAYPQQLVSPHVRAFSCWGSGVGDREFTMISDEKSTKSVGFAYWGPVEEPFRGFECALTKFAMAHRCFSAVYSYGLSNHEGHKAGKAMVTNYLNGEDILFQGTASFVTGLPPVFIQGLEIKDTGADDGSGISTRQNNDHFGARQKIVKEITKYLGFPWISQDFKIPKNLVTPGEPCPD